MDDNPDFKDISIDDFLDSAGDELEQETPSSQLPEEVFVLPITRRPLFPGMAIPVMIQPGRFYEMLKSIANTDEKNIGIFLTKKENTNIEKVKLNQLFEVGVLAKILKIAPMESGGAQVILNVSHRIQRQDKVENKYLRASVKVQFDKTKITDEVKAYSMSIITVIKELLTLNPLFKEELQIFLGHSDFTEPGKLADFAVALTTATRDELQDVLDAFDLQERITKALLLLKKELDLTKLQSSIQQKIEASISKSQKEYFLKEQLKTIKKELGIEKDEKAIDLDKFEARLKKRKPPADVEVIIQEELDKLNALDPLSSEYSVSRNYLDWLTLIPWGHFSKERHELEKAKQILSKDHYGLDEVKERILELISIGKLSKGLKGSIICLVGPPGVGKTSVGKSIARALNRKFYRFSVGGMRDEAEIKGHRRTYVGAMPGKPIQALKQTQVMNPVIMIDEVDKIGSSYHGDPASALLEVLDPEQNKDFLDHYLDSRVDLSHVLFVLTANVLDTIPEALIDRMEILRLSGYVMEEKLQIAKQYLIPRNRKEMGIKATQVTFTNDALKSLMNGYARESGVRALENYVKKILRKAALEIVQAQEARSKKVIKHHVTAKNLSHYIGKPVYLTDRLYEKTPPGVCTGLAWTSYGGAILYIETIKVIAERTEMHLTGQLGDVMKESSQIAWSYLQSNLHLLAPGHPFFQKTQVHIHFPEGATPKDGPSAGVTMVTALLSLLLEVPVKDDLGMTGEITVTGKVLAVGGIREKVIAARRSGLKYLILPKENQRDFDELPDFLKKDLVINYVSNYLEVVKIAFPKL